MIAEHSLCPEISRSIILVPGSINESFISDQRMTEPVPITDRKMSDPSILAFSPISELVTTESITVAVLTHDRPLTRVLPRNHVPPIAITASSATIALPESRALPRTHASSTTCASSSTHASPSTHAHPSWDRLFQL